MGRGCWAWPIPQPLLSLLLLRHPAPPPEIPSHSPPPATLGTVREAGRPPLLPVGSPPPRAFAAGEQGQTRRDAAPTSYEQDKADDVGGAVVK
uniref:Secreted protein n=1 Tax=Oryza meridionalis TaxID=40149 RepID=A0A0E0CLM4_9ORYZ